MLAEIENHSLKRYSQPGFLCQMEQDRGIKASNRVGQDAFHKKRFSQHWVSPRRTGLLSAFLMPERFETRTPKGIFSRSVSRNDSSPLTSRLCFYPFGVLVVGGGKPQEMSGQPRLAGGIAEHFGMTKWPFLRSPGRAEAEESSFSRPGCLATAILHPFRLGDQGASGCFVLM